MKDEDEIVVKLDAEATDEFETETYKDNKGEEHEITLKGKSNEFKDSKESIKQMLVKGTSYNVGGRHIEVMNVLPNRPGSVTAVVQVKQGGKSEKIELVLWNLSDAKKHTKNQKQSKLIV